jgi:hypothetical protein
MKRLIILLCLLFSVTTVAVADKSAAASEVAKDSFQAEFPSGGLIRMHVRSGDIVVRGTDENKVQVHYWGEKAYRSGEVQVSLNATGNTGDLRVSGGPHNDFHIEILVPRNSNLYLRIPAGAVEVDDLTGDKDIELHAGDLTVGMGKPGDYAHVDASVTTGGLDADPFDVSEGGLFRSFKKEGYGKYRLHAHVGAGQLTLR